MRFQVLMAASMKMAVFWDVASCICQKVADVTDVFNASIIRKKLHLFGIL
jgi:hypothetical protein